METYVSYLRVSSQRQGESGLGLEAQRSIVENYLKHGSKCLLEEFLEVESGKIDNRPELKKAISKSKETGSILIIAKLDRLSRNLTFISQLMDSHIKFVACDLPDANELTLHIMASLAQWERKRISERTKEALQAKRKREPNWKPGTNNFTDAGREKAYVSIYNNSVNNEAVRKAYHYICLLMEKNYTYAQIAVNLNNEGYRTRTGKYFTVNTVFNICKRFTELEMRQNKVSYLSCLSQIPQPRTGNEFING